MLERYYRKMASFKVRRLLMAMASSGPQCAAIDLARGGDFAVAAVPVGLRARQCAWHFRTHFER